MLGIDAPTNTTPMPDLPAGQQLDTGQRQREPMRRHQPTTDPQPAITERIHRPTPHPAAIGLDDVAAAANRSAAESRPERPETALSAEVAKDSVTAVEFLRLAGEHPETLRPRKNVKRQRRIGHRLIILPGGTAHPTQ
jgi:hypothetical protein